MSIRYHWRICSIIQSRQNMRESWPRTWCNLSCPENINHVSMMQPSALRVIIFQYPGTPFPLEEVSETVEERDQEGNTAKYLTVTFRQKTIASDAFNPFIEKEITILPAVIEKAEDKDGHWVIEAKGYGYYESDEGIDHKATVAADMARTAAFDIVTKKVVDLGIVSADEADAFRQELAKKKHLGGVYAPTGCGVYFTKSLRVRVSADGVILDDVK